ncbi:transcriptional regulator [Nocardia sp. NPDC005998]|uniref:transcriptional regulator n=1 Tax=Nocardia sp. NPDC005998 TaxID=3156894 RepID=UPI0033B7C5FD
MVGKQASSGTKTLEAKLVEHLTFQARRARREDLGTITRACLVEAARMLEARLIPVAQPAAIAGSAARWAREGIALETVLDAYHDGVRIGLEFLTEQAAGEDADAVAAAAGLIVRVLETVTTATLTAYLDEHRQVAREQQTAAQMLVSALLSGHGVAHLARRAGISVAASYQVVALAIPAHPDERRPGMGAPSAARRKLRRVQAALATPLGSRALSLLSDEGGTVLIPIDEVSAMTSLALTPEVLELIGEAAEVPLTAVVTSGDASRIPELAGLVQKLLVRLQADGRPPGLYRLADLPDYDGLQQARRPVVTSPNDHRITRSA